MWAAGQGRPWWQVEAVCHVNVNEQGRHDSRKSVLVGEASEHVLRLGGGGR